MFWILQSRLPSKTIHLFQNWRITMNSSSVIRKSLIIVAGTACFIFAALTFAQVQTQTTTTSGAPTKAGNDREW